MKKVKAYCSACEKMIDITEMQFINYDDQPMVLDVQLGIPSTERRAINFVKKYAYYDFGDYDNGEKMYHYNSAANISHMELGDDDHNLTVLGGYWSMQ